MKRKKSSAKNPFTKASFPPLATSKTELYKADKHMIPKMLGKKWPIVTTLLSCIYVSSGIKSDLEVTRENARLSIAQAIQVKIRDTSSYV